MLGTVFISISAHPCDAHSGRPEMSESPNMNMLPYTAKGFCKFAEIEDLETGRLSWSVQVGPVQS